MKRTWGEVFTGPLFAKIIVAICLAILAVCLFGCSLLGEVQPNGMTRGENIGAVMQTAGEATGGPLGWILGAGGALLAGGGGYMKLRKINQNHGSNEERIAVLETEVTHLKEAAKPHC